MLNKAHKGVHNPITGNAVTKTYAWKKRNTDPNEDKKLQ
jgi:hypothetical protein